MLSTVLLYKISLSSLISRPPCCVCSIVCDQEYLILNIHHMGTCNIYIYFYIHKMVLLCICMGQLCPVLWFVAPLYPESSSTYVRRRLAYFCLIILRSTIYTGLLHPTYTLGFEYKEIFFFQNGLSVIKVWISMDIRRVCTDWCMHFPILTSFFYMLWFP